MEPLSTEVAELRKEVLDLRMAVHLLLQKFDSVENILRHDGPPLNVCASSFTTPSTMSATPESTGQRSSSTTDLLSIPSCGTNSSMETTPLRFESTVQTEFVSKIPVRKSTPVQQEHRAIAFDQKLPATKLPAITTRPSLARVDTNEKYRKKLAQKLHHQQQQQQGDSTPSAAGSKPLPGKLFAGTPPSIATSQGSQSGSRLSGSGSGSGNGREGNIERYAQARAVATPQAKDEAALLHALEAAVISSPRLAGKTQKGSSAGKFHDPLPSFPASRLLLDKAGSALFAGTALSSPSSGSVVSAPVRGSREREPRIATPYPAPSSLSVGASPRTAASRPAAPQPQQPPRSHHLPAPHRAVRSSAQDAPVSKRALLWHGGQLTHHPKAGAAGTGREGEDPLHKTGTIRGGGKGKLPSPVPADTTAAVSPQQKQQDGAQDVLFGLQSPVIGARRRRSGGAKDARDAENTTSSSRGGNETDVADAADTREVASPPPQHKEASPAPPSTPLSTAPSPSTLPPPAYVPTPSFLYTPAEGEGGREERDGAFTFASNGVLASAYSSLLDESTDSTTAAASGAVWPQTDLSAESEGSPGPGQAQTPGAGDASGLFWEGMDTIIGSVPPPPTPATPFCTAAASMPASRRSRAGVSGGKAVKFAAPTGEGQGQQHQKEEAFEDGGEGVSLQVLMGGDDGGGHSAPHTPAAAAASEGGKKSYRSTPMPYRRRWPQQEALVEQQDENAEGEQEDDQEEGEQGEWGGDASTVGNTSAVELSFKREEDAPRFSDSESDGGGEGKSPADGDEEAAAAGWAGQRRLAEEAAAAATAHAERGEGAGTAVVDITDLFDDYVPVPAPADFDPAALDAAGGQGQGQGQEQGPSQEEAVAVAAAVLAANSSGDPEEGQADTFAAPRSSPAPGSYYAQLLAMLQQQEEQDRREDVEGEEEEAQDQGGEQEEPASGQGPEGLEEEVEGAGSE